MVGYVYKAMPKKQQDNAPGLRKRVFVSPRRLITTLAAPPALGAGDGDTIEISADHIFGPTDGFIEMYTTADTSQLTGESVGDRDSKGINSKLECFHPGLYKEIKEFAKWGKDEDWIVLVEDRPGVVFQLGSDGLECDMLYKEDSGKLSGGQKGSMFTFESFDTSYIYSGTITLKP